MKWVWIGVGVSVLVRFLGGFEFVFNVSRLEKARLIWIFVDLEDLKWFALGFIGGRIWNCDFFEIKSLFAEIDDGFMFRRSNIVNVGDWDRFLSVESKVELFG